MHQIYQLGFNKGPIVHKWLLGLRRENKEIGNKRFKFSYNEYMSLLTICLVHAKSKEHGDNRRWIISTILVWADLKQESEWM